MVQDFSSKKGIDAIRKEAFTFYNNLKQKVDYNIKFVSIENNVIEPQINNEVLYFPSSKVNDDFTKLFNPYVLHIFESNLSFLFDTGLIGSRIFFHASESNPLRSLSDRRIEEIVHLSDHDTLFIVVHSKKTEELLYTHGVRNVIRIFPFIDISNYKKPEVIPSNSFKNRRTLKIGFASMPFEVKHIKHRGFYLILDIAERMPDVSFFLANRSSNIDEILKKEVERRSLKNIFFTGIQDDMYFFYENIDIYLLPYINESENHAFPFSVIEAAISYKPVVVSNYSGISEFVAQYQIGIVKNPTSSDFIDGIREIIAQYDFYQKNCIKLREKFPDLSTAIDLLLYQYKRLPEMKVITLMDWRKVLQSSGSQLFKTSSQLKRYYQLKEVVRNYSADRFSTFPHSEEEKEELQQIDLFVSNYKKFLNKEDLAILDIATGDGRLLKILRKYGRCTAIDTSKEMLTLVSKKYPEIFCVQYDFISPNDFFKSKTFDIVTCFRFLRHLDFSHRCIVYSKVHSLLKDDGIFIFDAPNRDLEVLVRNREGWNKYKIYDVFWSKESLSSEMERAGFKIEYFADIGKGAWHGIKEPNYKDIPSRWIVFCRKINGSQFINISFYPNRIRSKKIFTFHLIFRKIADYIYDYHPKLFKIIHPVYVFLRRLVTKR